MKRKNKPSNYCCRAFSIAMWPKAQMATGSASLGWVCVECLVVSCSEGKWPLVVLA